MEMYRKKILYFTQGNPTPEEMEEAVKSGAMLRDASKWGPNDFTERCDEVMGDPAIIPEPYKKFIKTVKKVQDSAPLTDRPLEGMTIAELRDYAKTKNIQIPASITTKADIVAHLKAAEVAEAKALSGTPSGLEGPQTAEAEAAQAANESAGNSDGKNAPTL